jgi:hypothetical protein
MNLIDILNYQPLGDHGVNSLLSIRMFHIILITLFAWIYRLHKKETE